MKVLLFARARDIVGAAYIVVDRPEPTTIGELRQRLLRDYPKLSGLLAKSALAVNEEYADDSLRIPADAELALLPPVSGG